MVNSINTHLRLKTSSYHTTQMFKLDKYYIFTNLEYMFSQIGDLYLIIYNSIWYKIEIKQYFHFLVNLESTKVENPKL